MVRVLGLSKWAEKFHQDVNGNGEDEQAIVADDTPAKWQAAIIIFAHFHALLLAGTPGRKINACRVTSPHFMGAIH